MYKRKLEQSPENVEMQKTLKFYELVAEQDASPSGDEVNMEDDLRSSLFVSNKCKESDKYSQNLYAALSNNSFVKFGKVWRCGWLRSGAIVANLREQGDHTDWYCSGFKNFDGFVPEGNVTEEVRRDVGDLGWSLV